MRPKEEMDVACSSSLDAGGAGEERADEVVEEEVEEETERVPCVEGRRVRLSGR